MSQILTDIQDDEELCISVKKKYKYDLPSFGMIGTTERRTKMPSLDMHSILRDLSKNSTWFFWTLVQTRNPKNLAKFIPVDNTQAKQVTKAYKELVSATLVKRVRRGEYLINPKAYFPRAELFEEVQTQWESIK